MLNSHFRTYFAMCLPLCFNFLFGCFPSTFSTGALEDTAGAPASCILAPDWDFSSFDVPTGKILNFQNTRRHLQGAGTRLERKDTKFWTKRQKADNLCNQERPHIHTQTHSHKHTHLFVLSYGILGHRGVPNKRLADQKVTKLGALHAKLS